MALEAVDAALDGVALAVDDRVDAGWSAAIGAFIDFSIRAGEVGFGLTVRVLVARAGEVGMDGAGAKMSMARASR